MSPCLVSSGGSAGGRTPVTTVSLQSLQPLSLPRPPRPTPPLQRGGGAGHVTTAAVTAALPARLSRARTSGDTTPRDNSSSNSNNTCCRITTDNTVN